MNSNKQLTAHKPKFSVAVQTDTYKKLINNTLGDPNRAKRFVAAISSAVAVNPALQECDAGTILSAGLLGESLNLSPSPQLGQYYLVPYDDKRNNRKIAQFQMGYKGYIQLALRSGRYKKINVTTVKEGEIVSYNPFDKEIVFKPIKDYEEREKAATIGYYAMFELLDGMVEWLYWPKEKMEAHALKYSKAYKAQKGYSFWEKNFDAMAYKTMLRQLISKRGPMSIDMDFSMIEAYTKDMAQINTDGTYSYVDNTDTEDDGILIQPDESPEKPEYEEMSDTMPLYEEMPDDMPFPPDDNVVNLDEL